MSREYFFNFDKIAYIKGKKPKGCIFCLLRDRHPSVVDLSVYHDELFITTVNLYPYNPGHLLIIPYRHIVDLREYSPEEENRLNGLLKFFLNKLDRLHQPSAYNIGYNMGHPAGASIEHLHLHVIPRYPRELGIADLVAGKRVLVESPQETAARLISLIDQEPFSSTNS
ncbi:MAG TPA: HIT family protein [bacterium]|nr:HIT family protein [bacterium]